LDTQDTDSSGVVAWFVAKGARLFILMALSAAVRYAEVFSYDDETGMLSSNPDHS
jgi:hypothetical protein